MRLCRFIRIAFSTLAASITPPRPASTPAPSPQMRMHSCASSSSLPCAHVTNRNSLLMAMWKRSDAAPQVRRRDLQGFAVLRDRPPRDLDALALEQLGELAVGQRLRRALRRDELLDQRAHRGRGRVAAG